MSLDAKGPKFDKKRTTLHPDDSWDCPQCGTHHEHSHWEDHHQKEKVDKTFCDEFCKESDISLELDENNIPKPLFCPKCSWSEDRLILVKVEKGEVVYA